MAVGIRGVSSLAVGTNSIAPTIPSSVQAGDALFLLAGVGDAGVTWPTPDGWTLVERRSRDSGTTGMMAALYKRVASSGDASATVTLSASTTAHSAAMIIAFSGSDVVNPLHAWSGFTESAGSAINTHALPSVTTTLDQCMIVSGIVGKDSATTLWTLPAGYTKQTEIYFAQSGRTTGAMGTNGPQPIGTYSPGNAAQDGASKYAFAWTFAVAPFSNVQKARPVADEVTTSVIGVPTPGTGSGIYADVAADDDSHYARLSNGGVYECLFGALVDPGDNTGHTISYRLRFAGGAASGSSSTEIWQGATVIASYTDTAAGSFGDFSHTLTSTQAGNITDYSDLRVRFTATVA
jgi:hypothetical protein